MQVLPSSVAEVAVHGPDSPAFTSGLLAILGRAPRELLKPALPFSVIVENNATRTITLMGVRFDMVGARAKQYSVVHYADTLRNPVKADFRPGVKRFVCAEPDYTALVVRGEASASTRGRMNLDRLRRMLRSAHRSIASLSRMENFAGPTRRTRSAASRGNGRSRAKCSPRCWHVKATRRRLSKRCSSRPCRIPRSARAA